MCLEIPFLVLNWGQQHFALKSLFGLGYSVIYVLGAFTKIVSSQFFKINIVKGTYIFFQSFTRFFVPLGILSEKSKHFKSILTSFSKEEIVAKYNKASSSCSIYMCITFDWQETNTKTMWQNFLYVVGTLFRKIAVCFNPNEN